MSWRQAATPVKLAPLVTSASVPTIIPAPHGKLMTDLSPAHILQTGLAFWSSKVLLTAVELCVFTALAKSPADLPTLRSSLGLHERGARDFFDALVALGFLQRQDGIYQNTPETGLFLDRARPSYVGGILEMANARLFGFWNKLSEALKTGKRQNEDAGGGDMFEKLYEDPARLKGFLSAMTGVSRGANMTIARQFPWAEYRTFADVGTAQGDLAVQIALANPNLTGIGFDLPQVGPVFTEHAAQCGVADRVRFTPGSFFTDALPQADVILMGHILHDWGLETKKMLLRKAYDALPTGGSVVVYESIIDDDRSQNAFGLLMSLNMLIETDEGFDFTGSDCTGWMREAGFRETRVEHLVGPEFIVVGVK